MNLSLGSLNKKTLIQIVVLVLVVVVGAGFYFRMQGGDLGFLSGLFGKEAPKAPPPPPAPAPKPPEPEFPAHAPKGQLLGKPFAADKAVFSEGALVLRQTPGEVELRIYLPGNKWETPTAKKFKFENATGADAPRVHVSWKEEGKAGPTHREFSEKYSLKLEFGPEKDKKLPGKIKLTLPDEGKSAVAGTFETDVRGFRIVNGKPDLGADSVDTLEYIALREILKDDPDKPVRDVDLRDGHYIIPGDPAKAKTGYLEAAYQVGDGTPTVQRFQFIKDQNEWRVLRALGAGQIAEAHPHEPPTAESAPEKQMVYQTAARLEKDVVKKHPTKGIYGAEFTANRNDKNRLGVCEVSYRPLPAEEPVKASYLFRQKQGSWVLERELAKTETVDLEKGIIQKQPTAVKPKVKAKSKSKR
ncbi:MAG: hypothetical protein HY083_02470 [Gammaproteobacteria bacterium]|nr:hypothetical protein [Gammaproteobacteria bacterium]